MLFIITIDSYSMHKRMRVSEWLCDYVCVCVGVLLLEFRDAGLMPWLMPWITQAIDR